MIFHEIKRVLKDSGTLWLNLGDSYIGSGKGRNADGSANAGGISKQSKGQTGGNIVHKAKAIDGLKPKDLVGIPWRVAFALQDDGWYLRSDIIWNKPNCMPESVRDRPTKAHEYIFLLSKSKKYYYDNESIKEPVSENSDVAYRRKLRAGKEYDVKAPYKSNTPFSSPKKQDQVGNPTYTGFNSRYEPVEKRNKRTVWTVTTKPFKEAHFATYPPDLIEPCILAGCPEGGIVLDPFFGAGTTGLVAMNHNRNFVGIEINPEYVEIAKKRLGMSV